MDTKIFQNSYVIFVISFIVLYLLFYLTGFGHTIDTVNGKPVRRTSWKYPLGLSLIIWVFWHYYLYPPNDDIVLFRADTPTGSAVKGGNKPDFSANKIPSDQFDPKNFTRKTLVQKINMNNWT